jgi:hypothetical protein
MAAQIPRHPTRTRRRSPTATVPNPNPPAVAAPAPARGRHGHTREQGEGWPRGGVDLRRTAARERGRRQSWRHHHRRRMGRGSQRIQGGGSRQIRGGSSRRGKRRRIHASGGGDGEAGLEEADPRWGRTPWPPTKHIHAAPAPPQRAGPAPPPARICAGGWAPVEELPEGESHGAAARKEQRRAWRPWRRARGGDGGVREREREGETTECESGRESARGKRKRGGGWVAARPGMSDGGARLHFAAPYATSTGT